MAYTIDMQEIKTIIQKLDSLPLNEKVDFINEIKKELHEHSPFKDEPVDCVLWVRNEEVTANDYNPNKVAPPEMKLLETSITQDGYTQPIVSYEHDNIYEVVDGFHRHKAGKESPEISKKVLGYLPITIIKSERSGISDRMASTIRHNRARGVHTIDLMSNIVSELTKAGMSDAWILKHIGMDKDELLRLKQITGIADLFKNKDFSISNG